MTESGTPLLSSQGADSPSVPAAVSPHHSAAFLNGLTRTLWLAVPPSQLVLGTFGNVMTIVVMRGMRASQSTACLSVYFTALAVSDLCLLLAFSVGEWLEMAFSVHVKQVHHALCASTFFLFFASSMTSAWFLMAMTCQRMTSVILPHRVGVLCTVRRAKMITATLPMVAGAVCGYILLNFRVVDVDGQHRTCHNIDGRSAGAFFVLNLMLASAVPFLFLLIANCVLIRGVVQSVRMSRAMAAADTHPTSSRSAKVSSMTTTLIITSFSFLMLSIPLCIADFYFEETGFYRGQIDDVDFNARLTLAYTAVMQLWMCNSVVNFYLYILSGKKFRQETKRYLCLAFRCQKF